MQGFRKYLTQSKDHDELLAFLLGNIIKDRARYLQLSRHTQPELVTIKISELEERVRDTCWLREYHLTVGCRPKSMISTMLLRLHVPRSSPTMVTKSETVPLKSASWSTPRQLES